MFKRKRRGYKTKSKTGRIKKRRKSTRIKSYGSSRGGIRL